MSEGIRREEGTLMTRILFDHGPLYVAEEVEDVLNRIVNSRDGLRQGSGAIVAPAGWIVLTEADTDKQIYVQVSRVGYVCES
jgi:hypothetical protein